VRTRAAADTLLLRFLEELRAGRSSASSIDKARSELPRLFTHLRDKGVRDLRAVNETHLGAYARRLELHQTKKGEPLAAATRASALSMVRRFFAFLHARGLILGNPALTLRLPKAKHLPRGVLSEAQARRLMAAPFPWTLVGRRDRAILELLYGSGLRIGEAVRADLSDLDLRERVLLVRDGKGKKDRVVPVTGRAVAALELYLRDSRPALVKSADPALFLATHGRRLRSPGLRAQVERHGRTIGITLTPHVLRHACATHLLRGGASIRHVQELLGHKRLTTTALYTRVAIEDLRQVIARAHPRERPRKRPERR
jgi:integrase/recombinase XerD